MSKTIPAYQQIKNHILQAIHSGEWRTGQAIPTEIKLAEDFGVSRMTVNRALKELSEDQVLERKQGCGTFVAQQQFNHIVVEVRNIADDILRTGKAYRAEVMSKEKVAFDDLSIELKQLFKEKQSFVEIDIVHYADEKPIQFERRWVDVKLLPEFENQDFNVINTSDYLIAQLPLVKGTYLLQAIQPPEDIANALNMEKQQPALLLTRYSYSGERIFTNVQMWHDGSQHRFSGEF